MRLFALPALLAPVLAALPALAGNAADMKPIELTPLQIGQIFCIARIGNDMAPVEGLLTASLRQAIAAADARNDAWVKQYPDEKPPLGDGLPWQAHPDYTSDCTAGKPMILGNKGARVEVTYHFADAPDADYTDTLVLRAVPKHEMGDGFWRIDDVAFAGKSGMRQDMIEAFEP